MMKIKIAFLLALLLPVFIYSQSKSIQINWSDAKVFEDDYGQVKVPHFDENKFSVNEYGVITYVDEWDVNQDVQSGSVQIVNPVFETINVGQLHDVDISLLKNSLRPFLATSVARGKRKAHLELNPIIKIGNTIKRLKSCTLTYQFNNNLSTVNTFSNT